MSDENLYKTPLTEDLMSLDSLHPHDRDFVEAVKNGMRLRSIPYTFSVIILSFRRNWGQDTRQVLPGEWPVSELLSATLVTSLFGWWGVPWGIVWTIQSLVYAWRGGRDHTREALLEILGPERAKQLLTTAAKPKPPAIFWLVRMVILLPIGLLVWLYMQLVLF